MNHASLFSGIGGFDLAAEWNGWNNVFNCEWEEFPRKVLKHHFPNAKQYEDIKDFDATEYRGRIDVLSGGFPCQPFSVAGLRKGTEDERHLWPEMLRIIGECQPRWVVGENVRGLVSWSDGLVLETCYSDLEALGYSVQSFIIPACATNAPHRRDRVWIVAYAPDTCSSVRRNSKKRGNRRNEQGEKREKSAGFEFTGFSNQPNAPDTDSEGLEGQTIKRIQTRQRGGNGIQNGQFVRSSGENDVSNTDSTSGKGKCINRQGKRKPIGRSSFTIQDRWEEFPTVPPICGGDDGLPKELDGITFPKWRKESIKAYGNAIVPQVAQRIFESIQQYENEQP